MAAQAMEAGKRTGGAFWARPTYHRRPAVNVALPGPANVKEKSRGVTRAATNWAGMGSPAILSRPQSAPHSCRSS